MFIGKPKAVFVVAVVEVHAPRVVRIVCVGSKDQ